MGEAYSGGASSPSSGAVAVTTSDSTVIVTTRSLYIGATGNLTVRMARGMDATFNSVPVGIMPIQVDKVYATGTTASSIVAMY